MTRRLALAVTIAVVFFSFGADAVAQQIPKDFFKELKWRNIGPFRGGRNRAVAGVPGKPNVFYAGAVNGGVWRSDDYGRTWVPIFDGQPTQSVGDIAVAPSNPEIVYVASGEGLHRPDLSVGNGIYRSNDGGKSWQHLGLRDGQQIPALAIDPRNPDRLFAAVLGHPYGPNEERGIFRSTDGGTSWEKVLYRDADTGGADVVLDPADPNIVYASLWQARLGPSEDGNAFTGPGGGIFKSIDGGTTWKKLAGGLPDDVVQAHIAVAPSDPKRVYTVFSTTKPHEYATGKGVEVFRSDDAGETWRRMTDDPRPRMKIGGGDLPIIKVDPRNADVVYSNGIVLTRSKDGGKTWESFKGAPTGDDYQNIWINPDDPRIMLVASDQGAIVTVNDGATWSSWFNQPTAQFYHVSTTNEFPYKVCGGQQESGSACVSSRGNDGRVLERDWHPVGVIEYGYVTPDPRDPSIIYGAGRNEVSRFDWKTGQKQVITPIPLRGDKYRTTRTEPIVFSPVDDNIMLLATNFLFKSLDRGKTWEIISPDLARPEPGVPEHIGTLKSRNPTAQTRRGSIYSVAPSFQEAGTIWAGTDDGLMWITRDGGKNWKDITPPELTAWSKVTQIEASHFDPQTAYISVSRFRTHDMKPYIFRTRDGGATWQRIDSGLPNWPVNAVREDPVRKGMLYAASETEVWVSFDDGAQWHSLQQNLPRTSMRDIWIHGNDLIVATHGRSFWILDDLSSLRQLDTNALNASAHLFKPATALRIPQSTWTDTPIPPEEPGGENPPNGAVIDFYLKDAASGPVTIEFLDAAGNALRRFSSEDQSEVEHEELVRQLIPPMWVRPFQPVPTSAGLHRFVWDLYLPAPLVINHQYGSTSVPHRTPRGPLGPRIVPGDYTVRLTANGQTLTAALTVKLDPRLSTSTADLQQRFDIESRLAKMLDQTARVVLQARSMLKHAEKLQSQAKGALVKDLISLQERLKGLLDAEGAFKLDPSASDLHNDIAEVHGMVSLPDAAPTAAQVRTTDELEATTVRITRAWQELEAGLIQRTNAGLAKQKLPQLDCTMLPDDWRFAQRNRE